jgi:hypothetical protein
VDEPEPDETPDDVEPIVLPIEDALDLRGKGVQRAIVQGLLGRHPRVARFFDAPAERGGWGATVVMFRAAPPAGGALPGGE